jgi:hypothetical protein
MNPDSRIYQAIFNHIGQIKWQWRVLIYFGLSLVLSNFISVFYELYVPLPPASLERDAVNLFRFIGWLAGTAVLTWLLLKFLDKRHWQSIGLSFYPEWKKEFTFGLLLGTIMPLVLFVMLWPWGFISVSVRSVTGSDFIIGLSLHLTIWLVAAFWMELLLRGYFMQTMSEGMGKIVAAVFVSLMYALIRIQFHADEIVTAINTAAFGFIFAISYFRTRALWMGIGLHFSVNFIQNFIFGVPVMGLHPFYSMFEVSAQSRNIAVGSYFGMEQGLVAALILLSCVYYLIQSKQITISETVHKIKFDALSQPFIAKKK